MKLINIFVIMIAALVSHAADTIPSVTAKISVNKESPSETDLIITISNPSKTKVTLILDNDEADQFENLNLKVTTLNGTPVAESDFAKKIKSRTETTGSTATFKISGGKSHVILISLSKYFILPADGGYTVTGNPNDLVWVGEKLTPVNFKFTVKAED